MVGLNHAINWRVTIGLTHAEIGGLVRLDHTKKEILVVLNRIIKYQKGQNILELINDNKIGPCWNFC